MSLTTSDLLASLAALGDRVTERQVLEWARAGAGGMNRPKQTRTPGRRGSVTLWDDDALERAHAIAIRPRRKLSNTLAGPWLNGTPLPNGTTTRSIIREAVADFERTCTGNPIIAAFLAACEAPIGESSAPERLDDRYNKNERILESLREKVKASAGPLIPCILEALVNGATIADFETCGDFEGKRLLESLSPLGSRGASFAKTFSRAREAFVFFMHARENLDALDDDTLEQSRKLVSTAYRWVGAAKSFIASVPPAKRPPPVRRLTSLLEALEFFWIEGGALAVLYFAHQLKVEPELEKGAGDLNAFVIEHS